MVAQAQVLLVDAEAGEPAHAEVLPVGEPLQIGAGLAEELALHLLELAGAEGKVAGGDLVAERLAHLTHAEGQLPAGGAGDVGEVDEDALRRLRAEVHGGGGVLSHADGGLEHEVELADGGEVVLAAHGAEDVLMAGDEGVHLVEGHGVGVDVGELLADELVGAVTRLARLAVQQGIGEAGDVPGRDPRLGVHDDRRVQTDVVRALLHELLEPRLFDVVLELHAQRAVVPGVGKTAVDLAAGEDEAAVFAQVDDGIEIFLAVFHGGTPFFFKMHSKGIL